MAIADGDFFIACFSAEYQARDRSYMNEELILAVDELRKRPAGRSWFIPVLVTDSEIPDLEIGAGETLGSIQWIDLYANWERGITKLLSVIAPDSATLYELEKALGSSSARTRIHAADQLGKLGVIAKPTVPALTVLLDDTNETVRAAAASALGRIGSATNEVIANLVSVMYEGYGYASAHAAAALAELGHEATPALLEASRCSEYTWRPPVARNAREAVGRIRDPAAIPFLIERAKEGSRYAVEALGEIGTRAAAAIPTLVSLLNQGDASVQHEAVQALGRIGGNAAVPALTEQLESDNSMTRSYAVEALARIGSSSSISAIRKRLFDNDLWVLTRVIYVLDWPKEQDALETLIELSKHGDDTVRKYALEALARLGDSRAIDRLTAALNDDYSQVREAAARSLGTIGASGAVPDLLRALKREGRDSWVRDSIKDTLLKLGSDVEPEVGHDKNTIRSQVQFWASRFFGRGSGWR